MSMKESVWDLWLLSVIYYSGAQRGYRRLGDTVNCRLQRKSTSTKAQLTKCNFSPLMSCRKRYKTSRVDVKLRPSSPLNPDWRLFCGCLFISPDSRISINICISLLHFILFLAFWLIFKNIFEWMFLIVFFCIDFDAFNGFMWSTLNCLVVETCYRNQRALPCLTSVATNRDAELAICHISPRAPAQLHAINRI